MEKITLSDIAFQIAKKVLAAAVDLVPVGSGARKGELMRSLKAERLGSDSAVVFSNNPYSRAVHDGRPAMEIVPNVAKNPPRGERKHRDPKRARLKFKIGGQEVFAKSVWQLERKPNPFLVNAAMQVDAEGYDWLGVNILKDMSEDLKKKIPKQITLNAPI
jgi:hypothetical protein